MIVADNKLVDLIDPEFDTVIETQIVDNPLDINEKVVYAYSDIKGVTQYE